MYRHTIHRLFTFILRPFTAILLAIYTTAGTYAATPYDYNGIRGDSLSVYPEWMFQFSPIDDTDRYTRLTEDDYRRVADELGIEIATIKAVSDIEAGKTHQGFLSPEKPIINFSVTLFRQLLTRAGMNPGKYSRSEALSRLNLKKYGSYGNAQYARLNSAKEINHRLAIESTYWGMFQIGGFNWKLCGAESPDDFVELVSTSEAMQLELFARFITNTGMLKHLKNKNWKAFAKAYNGPRALKRGYHTRLKRAYNRYSNNHTSQ